MSNLTWQMKQNIEGQTQVNPLQPSNIKIQDNILNPNSSVEFTSTAGFLRRLAAFFIDHVILISFAIFLGGFSAYMHNLYKIDNSQLIPFFQGIYTFIVIPVYFIGFWTITKGQTPGKMLVNLRIVKTDETFITFRTSVIRFIGYLISAAIFWIGFIWPLFDSQHQAWHDKIAGTLVVKLDSENAHRGKIILFITIYELLIIASLILIVVFGRAFRGT